MRDQELVNALREHADWWENGDMMNPLGGLEKDLLAAADRIANQNTHIAALQQEIERPRKDGCYRGTAGRGASHQNQTKRVP